MPYRRIIAYTLVDITQNGSVRIRDANKKEYHQMQNLNVLLQTIGLRTQPIDHIVKMYTDQDLEQYKFDAKYIGEHTVWKLAFNIQHNQVFDDGIDEFGLLKSDATGIAITVDLDETASFDVNILDATDCVNIYFETE